MRVTVFLDVLNEEDLIGPWLMWHKDMFDHGHIVDTGCTDQTISIAKSIVPNWTFHRRHWPADSLGSASQLESTETGWKISLNVTEYLLVGDLKKFITEFERDYPNMVGIRTRGVYLLDQTPDEPYDSNIPMLVQKHRGYFEEEMFGDTKDWQDIYNRRKHIQMTVDGRSRLLHKFSYGEYLQGRHGTKIGHIVFPRGDKLCPESHLILCWLEFSPFHFIKKRIFQARLFGCCFSEEQKIERLENENILAYDLLDNKTYRKAVAQAMAQVKDSTSIYDKIITKITCEINKLNNLICSENNDSDKTKYLEELEQLNNELDITKQLMNNVV